MILSGTSLNVFKKIVHLVETHGRASLRQPRLNAARILLTGTVGFARLSASTVIMFAKNHLSPVETHGRASLHGKRERENAKKHDA